MKINGLDMLMKEFTGGESELKNAIEILAINKIEFEQYKKDNVKLLSVKRLKDLTGLGLRESKYVIDFYWDEKISFSNIKEERKEKLERLAKLPLVDELVLKIENLKEGELYSLLMKLSVDELLSIDEFLHEEE